MAAKLSPEQAEAFKTAFKMLDVDGDGRITAIVLPSNLVTSNHHEKIPIQFLRGRYQTHY